MFKDPYKKLLEDVCRVCRFAVSIGLSDSHGGNVSVRVNDMILIKASGKMLGLLTPDDFVATTLEENSELDREASVELKVHRAIYKALPQARAVLHTHAPFTVAASLSGSKFIEPEDSEGKLLLGKVPILKAKKVIGSDEVAQKLPPLLKDCHVAVVASHGAFSWGKDIQEALKYLSALENSCKIKAISKLLQS